MPTVKLTEIESRTLVTIHIFADGILSSETGFLIVGTDVGTDCAFGLGGWVPIYLVYAVAQGYMALNSPVDGALQSLERFGLIERSPPRFARLLTGRWTLRDGRTIETRGKCAEHPRGGPFWELEVFIDGTRAFGLSGPPDLTLLPTQYSCYRLTREGLILVRVQAEPDGSEASSPPIDDLVTLTQVAPLAGVSKRTLERWRDDGVIPAPDECGGDGRANKWYYLRIREAISTHINRKLPLRFQEPSRIG
jgi:hypothetical protein